MKKLDILGVVCVIAVLLLVLEVPELVKDKLTAATSTISQTSTARAVIISATENVPGDGKTPAKITVKVLSNTATSKNIPLANYCISAKHIEDTQRTDIACGPSGTDGLIDCSYTLATSTISKFKICSAVQCGSKPAFSTCGDPLDKTFINFYGQPAGPKSYLETIKNASLPNDPVAIVRATLRDSNDLPVKGYPLGSLKTYKLDNSDVSTNGSMGCGATDNLGVATCTMSSTEPGVWAVYDNKFTNSPRIVFSSPTGPIPPHIVWITSGGKIFKELQYASDATTVGPLKAIALSEIDVMGDVTQCERWEVKWPGSYSECFWGYDTYFKNFLNLKVFAVIDEPFGFPCSTDNPDTPNDERMGYKCRNIDATLKYVTEIAKRVGYSRNGSSGFAYDGIILDEPAYRSHQPGGDGNSIYRMDHPSRLIHKIFEETQKVHPGFKIILAENSSAFVKEMLRPGSDGVVKKYDMISGYWFYSPNPTYFKSLVPQYANGSGMWVNASTWSPYAAETIKKYGMNTVFYLFGTGEGLNVTLSTLRDQILPALK